MLTKEIQEKIIEDYKNKVSFKEISSKYGTYPQAISDIVNKFGVKKRGQPKKYDEKEIIDLYVNKKLKQKEIAKQLGLCKGTVAKVLHSHKIFGRVRSGAKYIYNESVWDKDTNQRNYWLGFMVTDGFVIVAKDKHGYLQTHAGLVLADKDAKQVAKFQKFLETTQPLSKRVNATGMIINNKIIVDKLIGFGIVPNKSFIAKVPEGLEFNRFFWCGAIDGDGCISFCNNRWLIMFCGSLMMCQSFCDFIKSITGKEYKPSKSDNIYRVTVYPMSVVFKILETLYTNNEYALERKKAKCKEAMQFIADKLKKIEASGKRQNMCYKINLP